MAKQEDEPKKVDEEDDEDEESESESEESEGAAEEEGALASAEDKAIVPAAEGADALAESPDEEEDVAAAQLGTDRYVLAGFFASGLLGAYVLGRTLQAVWATFANKDWFNQSLPTLAAVADDSKQTYSFIIAGIVALVVVLRTYRRPDVRRWCDDVAGELAKCVWPTKKEVYNSAFVVIVASAMATLYLALLDRLWAFVTNIVYGDGS